MGSIGSGWYGRRTLRATTADYPSIDVRQLQREGLLHAGMRFTATLCAGERLRTCVRELKQRVKVDARQLTIGQLAIRLERTRCTLGGWRSWFICPRCYRRCCLLYLDGGFGCRVCARLAYPVEREAPGRRALRRAENIMRRAAANGLGGKPSVRGRKLGKPAWMRWPTYRRLLREVDEAAAVIAERDNKAREILYSFDGRQPKFHAASKRS